MSDYIDDDRVMPRFRVNRQVMVDPAIFAQEREKIFDKSWLYVGHESELKKPNDFKTRNVGGRPVIFTRDAQGAVRVWINSCPHRGAMLCREGGGNAQFMTCFYHGWAFSTAGKMVSMPGDEAYGENFERPGLAKPAQLDSYRGFVFVNYDPNAVDLKTYLAGAAEYLDLICDESEVGMEVLSGTHEYSVRANWKLLCENSYDGYHAITTHQRYIQMLMAAREASGIPLPGGNTLQRFGQSRAIDLGNGHAVIASSPNPMSISGRPLSDDARQELEQRRDRLRAKHGAGWVDRTTGGRNLVIFPNLVVIDLVMGVVIRKIDPLSEGYMEVSGWEFAPPEEGAELRAQRLDNFLTFWGPGGLATPDDVEALETCQRSFASFRELGWSDISRGMNKDVVPGNDELQMRTWWRRWNQVMTGEDLPPEPKAPLEPEFTAPRETEALAAKSSSSVTVA
jgi:benzoate/toluate 1,2-dioxygenase alpha subunit